MFFLRFAFWKCDDKEPDLSKLAYHSLLLLKQRLDNSAVHVDIAISLSMALESAHLQFVRQYSGDPGWNEDPKQASPRLRELYDSMFSATLGNFRQHVSCDDVTWSKIRDAVMEDILQVEEAYH